MILFLIKLSKSLELLESSKLLESCLLVFLTAFSLNAQHLTPKTEKEITKFVKKEALFLKELKWKKYYKNFSKKDFVPMFRGEPIRREQKTKWAKKYLKSKRGSSEKMELWITTPFDEFWEAFDLYILSKDDLQNPSKLAPINRILNTDIVKDWNPKIKFTKDHYLVCVLPKSSTTTVPKYGEFMILQIIEKKRRKWKVRASYQ